jgi:hypothetical protein
MRRRLAETLVRLMRGFAPEEDLEPIAYGVIAAAEAGAEWWLAHPEEPMERQALRLMNFIWPAFQSMLAGERWLPPGSTL